MKFSLEFGKPAPMPPGAIAGSVITSNVARPNDAEILRGVNGRMKRMYDAAMTDNLSADMGVSITSANAEILVSIAAARSRARKLERDNPYAWGILDGFQNNIGGEDPFRLEMKAGTWSADGNKFTEDKAVNREIEEAWAEAGLPENCTIGRTMSRCEMDWQAISAVVRDGGIIARHYPLYPKNKFKYAIEPIEVDRLDHYWNRPAVGTANEIQFSIEMDEYHAPIAYWILTRHPGDVFAWTNSPKYRERVPSERVIALWDIRSRAGQYVGFPRFASIIKRLHRIDQFDIAHVTAAIWSSCKPFFLKRTGATANEYTGDSQSKAGEKISNVEPATGEILPDGYEVDLVDPKFPIEASESFKKEQLRAAASGSGAPYHVIGNDLEGVNFSSGRLGLDAYHDGCKKLQRHMILNYRRPHFNEWLKYYLLSGLSKIPFSRYEELSSISVAKFHGRRWPYVNPLQDAQADILRIEAGLTSRDAVIADSASGGDVESVNASIANGRMSDEAHDLDFTNIDPTKPGMDNGAPGEVEPAPSAGKKGGKQTIK